MVYCDCLWIKITLLKRTLFSFFGAHPFSCSLLTATLVLLWWDPRSKEMLGRVFPLPLTTSFHLITITNMRPICIYFPALPRSFNIFFLRYVVPKPTIFFFHHHSSLSLHTPQFQPHIYRSKYAYFFNNIHDTTLFLFFLLSPHSIHLYVSWYVTSHVSGSSNLFFVVLLSPPLPGLPTLLRASEIEEGAKLFGGVGRMGTRERLVSPPGLLQVDIHLVWEAMEWPSILCMGLPTLEGFLNELRICIILNQQKFVPRLPWTLWQILLCMCLLLLRVLLITTLCKKVGGH